MSKIKFEGNASGTGTFTVASPNSSTDRTLTLPDNTGTIITTASTFGGTGPAFSVYISSDQSISLSTWTKVQFNGEYLDTNNNFDSSTNYRFTPTVAGYYQINFVASGISSSGRAFIGAIYKNGVRIITNGIYMTASTYMDDGAVSIPHLFYMNGSTDYIEFYVYQDGGTGLVFTGYTVASGFLARAA